MALRPPSGYPGTAGASRRPPSDTDPLDHEIAAEKASALGRAGEKAERELNRLASLDRAAPERPHQIARAADAVYAYFIQRELCGLGRHGEVIREYAIPREVLVRLGAR